MHALKIVLAALLAFSGVGVAGDGTRKMDIGGELVIAPDGSVRDCKVDTPVAPAVRDMVLRAVKQWKFAPIIRGDHAIAARTAFYVGVEATPVDKQSWALHVTDVSFHNSRRIRSAPLVPPMDLMRARQNVELLVALRADKAGNVTDVAVVGIQNSDGATAVRNPRGYELWAERTVRKWTFDPAAAELGDDEVLEGMLPISFHARREPPSPWKTQWKDLKPVPWEWKSPMPDARQLQDGQVFASDDKVKLQTDVVGKAL